MKGMGRLDVSLWVYIMDFGLTLRVQDRKLIFLVVVVITLRYVVLLAWTDQALKMVSRSGSKQLELHPG